MNKGKKRVKLNYNAKIVLSQDTLVGKIATIMIDKYNPKLKVTIVDLPVDGFYNDDNENVVLVGCGYLRRVENSVRNSTKNYEIINEKGTGCILTSLWRRLFGANPLPEVFDYLKDMLDGDPDDDDAYAIMCYIEDNYKTICGKSLFDQPLEHTVTLSKQMIGM